MATARFALNADQHENEGLEYLTGASSAPAKSSVCKLMRPHSQNGSAGQGCDRKAAQAILKPAPPIG